MTKRKDDNRSFTLVEFSLVPGQDLHCTVRASNMTMPQMLTVEI